MKHAVEVLGTCKNSSEKEIVVVNVTQIKGYAASHDTSWMLNTIFHLYDNYPDASRMQGTIGNPKPENLPWLFEYQRGSDHYSSQMRVVGMNEIYSVSPVKATVIEHAPGFGERVQSSTVLVPVWLYGEVKWTASEAVSVQRTRYNTAVFYVKDIKREIKSRDLSKELQEMATEIFGPWSEKKLKITHILTEEESTDISSILFTLESINREMAIDVSRFFRTLGKFVSDPIALLEKYKAIGCLKSASVHYVAWAHMASLWTKGSGRI